MCNGTWVAIASTAVLPGRTGTPLYIDVVLEFANISLAATSDLVQISGPYLQMSVTPNTTNISVGAVLEFLIPVYHSAMSSGAAFNLSLSVSAAPGLEYYWTNCFADMSNFTFGILDGGLTIQYADTVALGIVISFRICANVSYEMPIATTISPGFSLNYDSATGGDTRPTIFQSVPISTSLVATTFAVSSTSTNPNGNSNISLHDSVSLHSTLTIPAGSPHQVIFCVTFPSLFSFQGASFYSPVEFYMSIYSHPEGDIYWAFCLNFTVLIPFIEDINDDIDVTATLEILNITTGPVRVEAVQYLNITNYQEAPQVFMESVYFDVNPLPFLAPLSFITAQNQPITFSIQTINSSPMPGTPDIVVNFTTPSHGSVHSLPTEIWDDNNGTTEVTYFPTSDFLGFDSFSYTVNNSIGGMGVGTVNIEVGYSPVLTPVMVTTNENTSVHVDIYANIVDEV